MARNGGSAEHSVPRFERVFFESGEPFMRIGDGELGGKARGLVAARDILDEHLNPTEFPSITVEIPTTTVVTTEVFDAFMDRNRLYEFASSGVSDERVAHGFQGGDLPVEHVGDLRALIEQTGGSPLAVRSSSLLEDSLAHPFAGVYATKMIPNNEPDPNLRFQRLVEAIKFVYASTFFRSAMGYIAAIEQSPQDEKMAVVIQEVVGGRYGDRFYPHLSGVCRSYNYYRSGHARPEEGVVNLALGLGKTIVDGGVTWSYSPAHPKAPPPFADIGERLKNTQLRFWAVNMGKTQAYDPIAETEYLVDAELSDADYDDTLKFVGSTFDATRGRLVPGTGVKGSRVIDFAPLLEMGEWPVNELIRRLLDVCERSVGAAVEIEFAMAFPQKREGVARLAFLQVRPMMVPGGSVDVAQDEADRPGVLVFSDRVMGNGVLKTLRDVVYVKPDTFEARFTQKIALELEKINRVMMREKRPYLLIGFGRWGSSDPWLGIPVGWAQISGAKVIVESTLPGMNVEASQGAHFFHNISSFNVSYFTVHHERGPSIDWAWLRAQPEIVETDYVRHVRLNKTLEVRVDGRSGRGLIRSN